MRDNFIPGALRFGLYLSARYLQELETELRLFDVRTRYERPGTQGIVVPRLYVTNAECKIAGHTICVMVWIPSEPGDHARWFEWWPPDKAAQIIAEYLRAEPR